MFLESCCMLWELHEEEKFILKRGIVCEDIIERIARLDDRHGMDSRDRIEGLWFYDIRPHDFYECWNFRYLPQEYIEQSSLLTLDSGEEKDIKSNINNEQENAEYRYQGKKRYM